MKNLPSPNFFPSNQLISGLFSKCVVFTKFLPKKRVRGNVRKFPCEIYKTGYNHESLLISRNIFQVSDNFASFELKGGTFWGWTQF